MNVFDLFDHLDRHPQARMLEPDQDVAVTTYPAVAARSLSWSAHFASLDVPAGTACVLPMRTGLSAVASFLGALHHGLFPILVKPSTPTTLLRETLIRAGGGVLVVRPSVAELLVQWAYVALGDGHEGLRVLRAPGVAGTLPLHEVGTLGILSSGSTGQPKIIVHALASLLLNAMLHASAIDVQAHDTVALSLPLNFSYGLVAGLLATILVGADGLLVDPQRVNLRRACAELSPTIGMSTPTNVLAGFGVEVLARLRRLTIGGDVLHAGLARQLVELVPHGRVFATYGLTEAGPRVASQALNAAQIREDDAVSLGLPLDGVAIELHAEDGNPDLGELVVDTPTVMRGYLGDETGTRAVLDRPGGTLRTGDMFRRREGRLFFAGRRKRIIIRGGENIYPALVENTILRLAKVEDAWVTADAHAQLGQVPMAYLLSREHVDVDHLVRELRRHIPASHIPVRWEVVNVLPEGARK